MDQNNRPKAREKNQLGGTGTVQKRGDGLGTGPVGGSGKGGSGSGSYRPSGSGGTHSGSGNHGSGSTYHGGGGGAKFIGFILAAVIIFFLLKFCFGGSVTDLGGEGDSGAGSGFMSNLAGALTDLTGGAGNVSDEYQIGSQGTGNWRPSSATLNTRVAAGSREKYTDILGGGKDEITIMVYLCGTDLESKHGMATADLQEMMKADLGSNINLIVYTGGCKKWTNNVVSSDKHQIYQIKNGKLVCLEKDMGNVSMTKPATLTKFINYCSKNFPANRNMLIFWDHGGGSLSGYGYDEKNASSGSMSLAGINSALKDAGIKYDFIGFDACLMATLENAFMLTDYADYLIASEETEPGVGWYYTNWLTALGKNPSMPTIEIGKRIVDDFVDVCDRRCNGQKTTLSVVDLAELDHTVPDKLTAFASGTKKLIQNDGYETVSNARYNTREFAQSSKIDQVDLVHLAQNMNSTEGNALVAAVLEAVKYNRTSSNMSHANGISIYFPYKKVSKVDSAVAQYEQIGMDTEYTRCIKEFASMETTGQVHTGSSVNGGSGASVGSPLGSLLSTFLGGSSTVDGQNPSSFDFWSGNENQNQSQTETNYVNNHALDTSKLIWTKEGGRNKLKLTEGQWKLVQTVDLNVFYDDGNGYIDLGLDNVYEFDGSGNLIGDYDGTWLSINGQLVPYYHTDTVEEGSHYSITGYVPVLLNGNRSELILVFDDARPDGYIAGARDVYKNGETQTVAKNLTEVVKGDRIEFVCDYYSYDGVYQDSYLLGNVMTYDGKAVIGNLGIDSGRVSATYRLTDIYNQSYWMPVLE